MRQLREDRTSSTDLAREVDELVQDLSSARPANLGGDDADGRRAALEQLAALCAFESVDSETMPPLVVTTCTTPSDAECLAQVQLQARDNNGRPIGSAETRLVCIGAGGVTVDDLGNAVQILSVSDSKGEPDLGSAPIILRQLEREILSLAEATKRHRNALRDEQKRVRALTRPAWLPPLARNVRALVERLSEGQSQGA